MNINELSYKQPKNQTRGITALSSAVLVAACALAAPLASAGSVDASANAEVDINAESYTRSKAKALTEASDDVTEQINRKRVENIQKGVVADPNAKIIVRQETALKESTANKAQTTGQDKADAPPLVDAVVGAEGEVVVADNESKTDARVDAEADVNLPWYKRLFQ